MTADLHQKFVVSLTWEGRQENRQGELEQALREAPDVEIIDGLGQKSFTVSMAPSAAKVLSERLSFATVLPYRRLKPLRSRQSAFDSRSER